MTPKGFLLVCVYFSWFHLPATANSTPEVNLDVKSYNSSGTELSCKYLGNQTGFYFIIKERSSKCLYQLHGEQKGISGCGKNCNMFCQNAREEPNGLTFFVKHGERCEESITIRCEVRKPDVGLSIVDTIQLPRRNNPVIMVSDGRIIEASLKPVQVACNVCNQCRNAKLLEISETSGLLHLTPQHNTSYTNEKGQFVTTVKTTAIFHQVGNITFTCKEDGVDLSANYTVAVQEMPTINFAAARASRERGKNCDDRSWRTTFVIALITLIICFILIAIGVAVVYYFKKHTRNSPNVDMDKSGAGLIKCNEPTDL